MEATSTPRDFHQPAGPSCVHQSPGHMGSVSISAPESTSEINPKPAFSLQSRLLHFLSIWLTGQNP